MAKMSPTESCNLYVANGISTEICSDAIALKEIPKEYLEGYASDLRKYGELEEKIKSLVNNVKKVYRYTLVVRTDSDFPLNIGFGNLFIDSYFPMVLGSYSMSLNKRSTITLSYLSEEPAQLQSDPLSIMVNENGVNSHLVGSQLSFYVADAFFAYSYPEPIMTSNIENNPFRLTNYTETQN